MSTETSNGALSSCEEAGCIANESSRHASHIQAMSTPNPTVAALPQTGTIVHKGANRHYGLLCWNNGDGAMADVPKDAYWSWGLGDSLMLVVPSKRIVVGRLGPAWQRGWGDLATIQPFFASVCAAVD